jgi:anti-sigma factor RsiW
MKCPEARSMISSYIDDELRQEERRDLIVHVESCPACRVELAETERLHGLFASAAGFEAPPGFATRVMARVDDAEASWFTGLRQFLAGRPFFLRTVEVAFALVIVAIGIGAGNLLTTDRVGERQPTVGESFSLDLFRATPSDSLGGAYMRLAGVADER